MKYNRFNRVLAMMLTLVMTSMLITPILAATRYEGTDKKTASKKNSPNVRAAVIESIKTQDDKIEFSPEELEQMRSALLELLDSVQEVSGLLSPEARSKAGMKDFGKKMSESQSDEARIQIQNMSSQELTVLRKVLNPAKMRTKLATSRSILNEYKDSVSKIVSETGDRPGLPGIDSYCGAPVPTGVIIASDVVFFIAEGVRDVAQNGCNQVAVVVVLGAGGGGNTRLACTVTDAIYLVAKALNQAIHFCDDDYAASVGQASYDRLGHMHDDIEDVKANENTNYTNIIGNAATNTTTITTGVTNAKTDIISNNNTNKTAIISDAATNKLAITTAITNAQTAVIKAGDANSAAIISNDDKNKTTIVDNDNTNKTTIVNNDNANTLALTNLVNAALTQIINNATANKEETRNLLLRTQIEADLASTDGSTFVALYETPVTVCFPSLNPLGLPQAGIPSGNGPIQCGLLDLVRSIVSQTIVNGGNNQNALKDFATGDSQRAAGQYKSAYASYRKAYKMAS
jgi:hypothetical protein